MYFALFNPLSRYVQGLEAALPHYLMFPHLSVQDAQTLAVMESLFS